MAVTTEKSAGATATRPFKVEIQQEEIDELRRRLRATRWPEKETVADESQGVQLATMQELARYWADDYDFGRLEARLSAVSALRHRDRRRGHPLHPRAVATRERLAGDHHARLARVDRRDAQRHRSADDPTAHGGDAEDAFDVVVPSMPGYGFSGKPTGTGWGPVHIADAWFVLMKRLGYGRFVAQGGDWGAQITDTMGAKAPPELIGIHSNMPGTVPAAIAKALSLNVLGAGTPPSGLSADEQRAYDRLNFLYTKGLGYGIEMGNRPQTLYGLADSPVALAAWMLDHDAYSHEDIASAFEGEPVGNLTRDEVLDNITLTWVTNTGVSSGRLYWENTLDFFDAKGVTVPAAVSVFPRELYQAPRSWAEQAYPNLIYFNELDRGNHFAAWQEPELFTTEVRAAFRSLR